MASLPLILCRLRLVPQGSQAKLDLMGTEACVTEADGENGV